jgi:hypothetical protein
MALNNKTSIFAPSPSQTSIGKSGDSKLLSQATTVKSTSPIGNPSSDKLSQATSVKATSPIGNPSSDKLSQATTVKASSILNNPNSNKITQTQNAYFNVGKASQFSNGGLLQSFSGKTVAGASVSPTFTPLQLFFQRSATNAATIENQTPITSFYNNINTIEV